MYPKQIHLRGISRLSIARAMGTNMNPCAVWLNQQQLDPAASIAVRKHSPEGFCWGYAGSGPAQLALAICLEIYPYSVAKRHYQEFKRRFIATLAVDRDFEQTIDLTDFNQILPILKGYEIELFIEDENTKFERQVKLTIHAEDVDHAQFAAENKFYDEQLGTQLEYVYRSEIRKTWTLATNGEKETEE